MDPLTRGSLFHSIQTAVLPDAGGAKAGFRSRLRPRCGTRCPARSATSPTRYRDDLAPAVPRVWDDEVRVLERDLLRWLEYDQPGSRRLGAVAVRVRLRASRRSRARSAEPRVSRPSWTGAFACVARSISSSGIRRPGGCASPITRPAGTAARATRSSPAATCCSRCSTPKRSRACSTRRCSQADSTSARRPADSNRTRFRSSIARVRLASRRYRSWIAPSSSGG